VKTRFATCISIVLLAMATIVGCGSDSPHVSADASAQLTARVEQLRTAANTADATSAAQAIAAIRSDVAQLHDVGHVSDAGAASILDRVADVERQLATALPTTAIPPTTTTIARTTTVPPTTTAEPHDDEEDPPKKREHDRLIGASVSRRRW
jgi:hypothetical protein